MRKYVFVFSLPCVFIVLMVLGHTSFYRFGGNEESAYSSPTASKRSIESVFCESMLVYLNTTVPILLVDPDLLEKMVNQDCTLLNGKPVKVAVNVKFLAEPSILEDSRFTVIYYTNGSNKDYLDFRTEPRRIVPRKFNTHRVANVDVPSDIPQFLEFWKRSKFVECMNLYIPRAGAKVNMKAVPASGALARLRDELTSHGMFPFLNGGTLLGWYRECSVIPHTTDMDLAVFSENYRPGFLESMQRDESRFRLSRKLGMVNDSFELTVAPKEGYTVFIDIFVMYKAEARKGTEAHHWVGGLAPDGTKYKYSYPVYDPWCAADLHGHLFWVTCSPNEKLVNEYGKLWYRDHHTLKYSWSSSGKNVKENGKWTAEQMKSVYNVYG